MLFFCYIKFSLKRLKYTCLDYTRTHVLFPVFFNKYCSNVKFMTMKCCSPYHVCQYLTSAYCIAKRYNSVRGVPMFIDPMLLATAPGPFSDLRFIFEPKVDGHRLIYSQKNGVIRLYTRHNNDCTRQYPEIAEALFPHDIVLDGEIACVDPATGNSDFEAVMTRFQARKVDKIATLSVSQPTTFVIFDVLQYNGRD